MIAKITEMLVSCSLFLWDFKWSNYHSIGEKKKKKIEKKGKGKKKKEKKKKEER